MIGTAGSVSEPREMLDSRWGRAKVAVIRAQLAYADLASCDGSDERELDAAWLRLWRAQEEERALDRALQTLEA